MMLDIRCHEVEHQNGTLYPSLSTRLQQTVYQHSLNKMSATAILEAVPGDPFSSIPAPQEGWHAVKIMAQGDSTSEYTLEATQVQRDILQEPIQWATAELPLPEPLPSFQAIENAWNTLASYREYS